MQNSDRCEGLIGGSETNMQAPNLKNQAEVVPDPEMIDDENPEWTDEDFAKAVPFSGLPAELQKLLSEEKHIKPDAEAPSDRQPAA